MIVLPDEILGSIFFAHNIISELQEKMDKISSSDANITVEIITASKPSIHIYNISGGMCDEDLLNVYFGKSKNGGGRVESVQILGDSGAIVTFADAAGTHICIEGSYKYALPIQCTHLTWNS